MAADDLKTVGLKELVDALDQLPIKMEKKFVGKALRVGAAVMRAIAQRLVPVKTGWLKQSIRVVSERRKDGFIGVAVRAGGKITLSISKVKIRISYASLVEFGTAAHHIAAALGHALKFGGVTVKGVDHPGSQPKPFMRPAFDTGYKAALDAYTRSINDQLEKEYKKSGDTYRVGT